MTIVNYFYEGENLVSCNKLCSNPLCIIYTINMIKLINLYLKPIDKIKNMLVPHCDSLELLLTAYIKLLKIINR